MSVDKKDFDPERSSPGVDDSGPVDIDGLSDPDAPDRPKRRKRGGLRVPSDNVPRPQATGLSGPVPTQPAMASAPTLTAAPPAPAPVPERLDTDLEVDVDFVDDEAVPTPAGQNGSGRHGDPAAAAVPAAATSAASAAPSALTASALAPPGGVAAPSTVDRAWTESEELDDGDLIDEDRGEPTHITAPSGEAPAVAAASSPSVVATSAALSASLSAPMAASAPTPATPSTPSMPPPAAPPMSPEVSPTSLAAAFSAPAAVATSPASRSTPSAAADEPEEISPAEFEEVDSGPVASAAAQASTPPAAAPHVPSYVPPVPSGAHPVAPHSPPPAPPAAARTTVPPKPPAPAANATAANNAAARDAAAKDSTPPRANAAAAAAAASAAAQPRKQRRKGKAWYEEIFDEDYLRTLPFLTPQATQREAAFLLEGLGVKPGHQVLDLGCGYGRHAMELAARGYHVVGLDLSLPLLIRGADEAQRRGLTINFVHGDMRELTFDAQFDGAYCVFSTFGYFDDETNKRVAQNVARALKPGAKLVIDILNRDYITADLPTRVWWEGDGCVVLEEVDFNYFTSRLVSNRSVVFEDGRQLEQEISIRAYSLHELGKLLHQVGFRVTEVSGGLATRGRFFGNDSRQIIVVAERRADKDAEQSSPGTKPSPQ